MDNSTGIAIGEDLNSGTANAVNSTLLSQNTQEEMQTSSAEAELRPVFLVLSFDFSETESTLYAVLTPGERKQEISEQAVENWLKKHNFNTFFRKPDTFAKLLSRIENGKEGKFAFARRYDAEISVRVDSDRMLAYVSTKQACGGALLDNQKIQAALQEAKIDPRFYNDETFSQLINGPAVEDMVLARGTRPVDGTNARLVFLVQETINKKPSEDANGNIKFHELNEFVIVEPGTPVQRKEPATSGTDGYDVCGTVLPAIPGKDMNFSNKLSGVGVDPKDENLLIALIKGHPLLLRTVVKVDPVLHLGEINFRSGNIDFDGTVSINGDVHAGMVVTASGDIHVNGIVEKATIIAGNDISVTGGVIGADTSKDSKKPAEEEVKEDEDTEPAAHASRSFLKAGGSISAKYISHVELECDEDLVVSQYLMHSNVTVHGQLLLGQASGKGCLIGGHSFAGKGVRAKVLGNETYLKTHLSIGYPLKLAAQLRELHTEQEKQTTNLARLKDGLIKLNSLIGSAEPGPQLLEQREKFSTGIVLLAAGLEKLEQQVQGLLAETAQFADVQVCVSGRTFPNVFLGINGMELKLETELGVGYFKEELGKIKFCKKTSAGVSVSPLH